jgi:hypothetical protein
MAEVNSATQSAQPAVDRAGSADIVLGVLSYNDAETIGPVIRAARSGLSRFSGVRAFIVNADGGSRDGTLEAARAACDDPDAFLQIAYPVYPVQRMMAGYPGVPGKGNALRAVFQVADQMGARACAVVQSDVRSITPDWVESLVRPVLDAESDYVTPLHQRHKYEATVLSGMVYPLIRALYGKRVREPIGGDFAFSPRMMNHYLKEPQSESEMGGAASDLWMTTQAIINGFRLAEARLGPRQQAPRDPPPELSGVLALVLGALFLEVGRTAAVWQRTRSSEPVQVFGPDHAPAVEQPSVDTTSMIESFRLGYQNLQEVWKAVLPPATLVELKRLASRNQESFRMPDAVWARIVYDFVLAHRMRVMDRTHLLRALTPLYLGWLASYILQVQDLSPQEAEQRIEALCIAYETQKAYLISRWRWPDRFNP